jgi:hypothetical protein
MMPELLLLLHIQCLEVTVELYVTKCMKSDLTFLLSHISLVRGNLSNSWFSHSNISFKFCFKSQYISFAL